jgi:hypothetical protein|tara:strand:+ start:75 stop:332 length:258 start_codon:yes stop_codon:yes gene_type:complete
MAYCDVCGNFDKSYLEDGGFNQEWKDAREKFDEDYQPNLYYFWDGDFCEEDYDWREHYPKVDCMCEVCFGIANQENKVKWNCTNL